MSNTVDRLNATNSGMALRLTIGAVLGVMVTLSLLWLMNFLIAIADHSMKEGTAGHMIDFVRVKRPESTQRKDRKPEKPPAPKAPPPEPPSPQMDDVTSSAEKIAISAPTVETDISLSSGGFSLGAGEGDYLPIVKVAPIYPARAANRGIEGYCIVQYTVTRKGTTKDVVVVESDPPGSLFHRASINAAYKFKYKPRIIDGEAVEVPGVMNRFTYELEK